MKKLLSAVFLLSLVVNFTFVVPNINAMQIQEGAIIKTDNNPDVYIVKYKNGKQFKRLVLNPQVFESYGHLRWEDILTVSQNEMDSFVTSDLVRVDGQTDIYQLVPNGDIGTKTLLESTIGYDLDLVYTINGVDGNSYITEALEKEKEEDNNNENNSDENDFTENAKSQDENEQGQNENEEESNENDDDDYISQYATVIELTDSKGNIQLQSEYNNKNHVWSSPYPVLEVGETVTITVDVNNNIANPVLYEFIGTGFPNVWQTENQITVTIDNDIFNLETIHLRVFIKNSDEQYRAPYYDDMIQVFYMKEN